MYRLGLLFLVATALAQPTVYVARSSLVYPSYRVYLDGIPEIEIIKEPEAKDEPELKVVPEAPVLEPLPMVKSVELEVKESKEEMDEWKDEEIDEKKEEKIDEKKDEEIDEKKEEEIDEKKEEELEHKSEQDLKEEVLKDEAPKKEESEEDKKVVVELEVSKPPKFITSFISALPIKLPSFELPFNLGSFWKPKEKQIRFMPAYNVREWSI